MVGAAVNAPPVHNTQPWWFTHHERVISVHVGNERQLQVADPHGREMMLHHHRTRGQQILLHDPSGNPIELFQPAAQAPRS